MPSFAHLLDWKDRLLPIVGLGRPVAGARYVGRAGAPTDDDAGVWENGEFDLDLSPKIKAPATYQLRFVGQGGPAEVTGLELTVGGAAAPQLVRMVPKRPDLRIVTVSEVGQPIRVKGQISGVLRGNVLVRRTGAPVHP